MTKKIQKPIKPHPFNIETPAAPAVQPEPVQLLAQPAVLPWLTMEWALYGLIFALALALRLWRLGSYPLSEAEAQQSLSALALYRSDLPSAGFYSPLLVSLNALAFLLFGSSEASARLASLLLGMILVVLPLTLRRQLGGRVCLLATALLAISPLTVYLSRTLNNEIGVAAGALMMMSGFFNWRAAKQQHWLLLLAAGLALMLTSGPMVYSVLIVFGLAAWLLSRRKIMDEVEEDIPGEEAVVAVSPSQTDPDSPPLTPTANSVSPYAAPLSSVFVFFLVTLALLSTAALFNIRGLGMLANTAPDWLSRFSFAPQPDGGFNAVFLLTIYDPLLVLCGLAGLAMLSVRRSPLPVFFGVWFGGLLVLDLLMAGRSGHSVILLVAPLAFLAATSLAALWKNVEEYGSWANEGLLVAAGLALAVFGYIYLTGWLVNLYGADTTMGQYSWVLTLVALLMLAAITIFFWMMSGPGVAVRGLALVAVALGLLLTLNIGSRLNYGPLHWLAYQPLAQTPAATGLEAFTETLALQSAQRVGDKTLLDISLAGINSPSLRWQLRNYRQLQTGINSAASTTTAIITPPQHELGLPQPYLGQDFILNARWSPVGLPPKALIKWLLYRQADTLPEGEKIVLWLRQEGTKE